MSGEFIYSAGDIIRVTGCTKSTIYQRLKDGKKICGVKIEILRTIDEDEGHIRVSKTSYEKLLTALGIRF